MPKRKRSRVVQRYKKPPKRKRLMDDDCHSGKALQLASPHQDDLNIENPVNVEPALKKVFKWCYNKLPSPQSAIATMTQLIFKPRSCNKSHDNAQLEMSSMKNELAALKAKVKELEMKLNELADEQSVTKSSRCNIPPAPPPPPPPPPLPPLVDVKIMLPPRHGGTQSKKQDSEMATTKTATVTLEDILKVKLKKPSTQLCLNHKEDVMPSLIHRVTLSDLTSVMLKSARQKENTEKNHETPKSNALQQTLRKTSMKRSPGGTPLVKRDHLISTGTGPTPEFTMALRRKFRSVRSSPLLENGSTPSPR